MFREGTNSYDDRNGESGISGVVHNTRVFVIDNWRCHDNAIWIDENGDVLIEEIDHPTCLSKAYAN